MGDVSELRRQALRWRQSIRSHLVAVPLAYLACAVLAVLALYVADRLEAPTLRAEEGQLAEDLLPAIGSATLTLAGFVLTISTLSIQFTATSYAPRLVEPLRRDRALQHTLGASLGTFAFSFGVLLGVGPEGSVSATVAVGVALAGAAATLLLFIALLDRLTDRLRPGRMMRRVAEDGLRVARSAYAARDDDEQDAGGTDAVPDRVLVEWDGLPAAATVWRRGPFGVVVGVGFDRLVELAAEHDVRVELTVPVGAFIGEREAVATVRTTGGTLVAAVGDELTDAICGTLVVDAERTADADPAYSVRLLVDSALRALSSGVNDPTTASQAIEHVEQLLFALAGRRLGPQTLRDDEGVPRLVVPAPGWDALVELAYAEILDAAGDDQTTVALRRSLARLRGRVAAQRREALDHMLGRVGRHGRPGTVY